MFAASATMRLLTDGSCPRLLPFRHHQRGRYAPPPAIATGSAATPVSRASSCVLTASLLEGFQVRLRHIVIEFPPPGFGSTERRQLPWYPGWSISEPMFLAAQLIT